MQKAFPIPPIPTIAALRVNSPALTGPPYRLVPSAPLVASTSLDFLAAILFRSDHYSHVMASNPSAFKGRSARILRPLLKLPAARARLSQSPICKFQSPSTPTWISSSICQTGPPASTQPLVLLAAPQLPTANVAVRSLCRSRCRLMVATTVAMLAFTVSVSTVSLHLLPSQHCRPALQPAALVP
jgi:hypothetical protein